MEYDWVLLVRFQTRTLQAELEPPSVASTVGQPDMVVVSSSSWHIGKERHNGYSDFEPNVAYLHSHPSRHFYL